MKEELPDVGDLAYVKSQPCCHKSDGLFFRVVKAKVIKYSTLQCADCNTWYTRTPGEVIMLYDNNVGYPREWLRKVPPLDKPEPSEHNANLSDKIAAALHKQFPTKV